MKFNTLTAAAAAATALFGAGSAAATPNTPAAFDMLSLRPDTPIHVGVIGAARSGIWIRLPRQNATCESGSGEGYATFYIEDEELFLYSTSKEKQRVFTDRSGMGQGVIGYNFVGQGLPRYGEVKGWRLDKDNNLMFKDNGLTACYNSQDDSWRLWVDGFTNPGGNTRCLSTTARTLRNTVPVSCTYTQG